MINTIAAIIVTTAGVLVALKTIYDFVKKPKEIFKRELKKELNVEREEILKHIKKVMREEVTEITDKMTIHTKVLLMLLSAKIEEMYLCGLKTKTVSLATLKGLTKLYDFYSTLGGNGHMEQIIKQMQSWAVVDIETIAKNQAGLDNLQKNNEGEI